MNDLPHPVKLLPLYLPKPWGGRRMERVLGRDLPGAEPIGECWLVHDRDGRSSEVIGGALDGTTLASLRGDRTYPLLVKLIDASAKLSLQVHPDEAAAERRGGEAKTECWFVLHADPGAKVYRGLRGGVTRAELKQALTDGTVAECLHAVEVEAGDAVFIPSGMVHTIGPGVLLAEVQQNSDTTFRLHDWGRVGLDGRPRTLRVDAALESIDFRADRSPDKVPMQLIEDEGRVRRLLLVKCRHFTVEHVTAMGTFTLEVEPGDDGTWPVLHVLSGRGDLRPFDRSVPGLRVGPGDTVLLPSRYEEYEVTLGASVVRALLFRR